MTGVQRRKRSMPGFKEPRKKVIAAIRCAVREAWIQEVAVGTKRRDE